jgi:hypothetical protein
LTRDDDFIRQLEGYLEEFEGATPLPVSVRDALREELPMTGQVGPRVRLTAGMGVAAAVIALVAFIGFSLLPSSDSPGSVATPSALPSALPVVGGIPRSGAIEPGRYMFRSGPPRVLFTVPEGWISQDDDSQLSDGGRMISRYNLSGGGPTLVMSVHDVTHIKANACVGEFNVEWVEVGPAAEDLTAALLSLEGLQRSGPTDVTLGGYPAKKIDLVFPSSCPGPEGTLIWADGETTYGFWLLKDGMGTAYVVDVNGDRVVITTFDRGASASDLAKLDAIIASIDIEP